MKFQYFNTFNQKYSKNSFREYYKTVYGTGPCPVDRFNLLVDIDPQTVQFNNIVPAPIYNLNNLPAGNSNIWRDRFFSLYPSGLKANNIAFPIVRDKFLLFWHNRTKAGLSSCWCRLSKMNLHGKLTFLNTSPSSFV